MGINYYKVISTLFEFKDRLKEFATSKNQTVIDYFVNTLIDVREEDAKIPELKNISEIVNLPRSKVNEIVKDPYEKLLNSFTFQPIKIKEAIVSVFISIPWDEADRREIDQGHKDYLNKVAVFIDVTLPYLPRIGEEISFEFLDRNAKFYRGYVHEV